jgi:hypothetical protein
MDRLQGKVGIITWGEIIISNLPVNGKLSNKLRYFIDK